MKTRIALGAVGVTIAAFGALRFLQTGLANMAYSVAWLVGGVAIHDGLIAPATILLTLGARPLVPRAQRSIVTLAAVVLATVTVTAIPVLGRFGARSDNLTLLPRNYVAGWFVFAALVLVCALAAGLWSARVSSRRK
ncbi:MAG: hypothetical protein JWR35_1933 [Marmoricola sp.]|nr:hypothetical protein [Marmoricola sp.]